MDSAKLMLIGGPTALIEVGGFRLLTDPTFDPPGEYVLPHVTLRKLTGPAIKIEELGPIDAVLLSHDQHADNLDNAGRTHTVNAPRLFTTFSGAARLGRPKDGMAPWESATLAKPDGRQLTIVATPARHGPAGIEPLSGDVTGFLIQADGRDVIYVTGDTVWYEGTAEVAHRFSPSIVMCFAGAAKTRGPFHLTMDANEVLETAHAFPSATIVPIHCEGWAHFSQNCGDLEASFKALGLLPRLKLLEPGMSTEMRW